MTARFELLFAETLGLSLIYGDRAVIDRPYSAFLKWVQLTILLFYTVK